MRLLLLIAALTALPVHADLYRWIDRETGSVKFSNTPPPWYGDPDQRQNAPVELIPYRSPGAPVKPPPEAEGAAAARALAALEARWVEFNKFFLALPPGTDLGAAALRPQIESYVALSAQLDRLDPAGAVRRRAQDGGVMDRVRRGLEVQLMAKPPGQ